MIIPFFTILELALLSFLCSGIVGFVPSSRLARSMNFVETRTGNGNTQHVFTPSTTRSSTIIIFNSRNNEDEEEESNANEDVDADDVLSGSSNPSDARRKLEDLMARSQSLMSEIDLNANANTNVNTKKLKFISPPPSSPTESQRNRNRNRNQPLFGEIPVDGSILVVAPAAVIAIVGLFMSVIVIFNSSDVDVLDVPDANVNVSSAPVSAPVPAIQNDCRGLCSNNQEEQLDKMSNFMNGLTKTKKTANAMEVEVEVTDEILPVAVDKFMKEVQVLAE